MTFTFTLKIAGKLIKGSESDPFNGTRQEAYLRAKMMAVDLAKVLKKRNFSVLVDRTDAPAKSYEIGPDGHTID